MTKGKGHYLLRIAGILMIFIAAALLLLQAWNLAQGYHTVFDSEQVVSLTPGGNASEVFWYSLFELLTYLATFGCMLATGLLCFRHSTKPKKATRLIIFAIVTLALLVLCSIADIMLVAILTFYHVGTNASTSLIAALGLPVILGLIGAVLNKQQKATPVVTSAPYEVMSPETTPYETNS